MENVLVVESPAKAKTIEKFLGKGYKVVATYGHVRDLPKSRLGIDVDNNYEPDYIIPRKVNSRVKELKSTLIKVKNIYLATDFDREGEAIAWHVTQAVPLDKRQKVKRIVFTEITKDAIKKAVNDGRNIDLSLVDAQQARRILDRLVGYKLSPVLWKKVRAGLSAGRVQSVALKLIVDREREIEAFKPEEYWSLTAKLLTAKQELFEAELIQYQSKKIEVKSAEEAKKIETELNKAGYRVAKILPKEINKSPAPPFITSTLQQESARRFGYTPKKTMMIAQQLYEGIATKGESTGLISYMRTDSFNLSNEALNQARSLIPKLYSKDYLPDAPRFYKRKVKRAQEAHEAIRPTDFSKTPESIKQFLTSEQFKVYNLIWKRTLACQMANAKYLQTSVDVSADDYTLRATGRITLFDGFTKLYLERKDDDKAVNKQTLPKLTEHEKLTLEKLTSEQHFSLPPFRYSDASLIKKLEESGIGRPSTYAPIISTLMQRGYIDREKRVLMPQQVGFQVTDLLAKHFPFVVSIDFTAEIENKLDAIADGKINWRPVVGDFYMPFEQLLEKETDNIEKVKPEDRPTDEKCDVCGRPMVIKSGRFGDFLACTGYPECKNTKTVIKNIGIKCPDDGGDIIERRTRKGKLFYGCSNYPKCHYATWTKPSQ